MWKFKDWSTYYSLIRASICLKISVIFPILLLFVAYLQIWSLTYIQAILPLKFTCEIPTTLPESSNTIAILLLNLKRTPKTYYWKKKYRQQRFYIFRKNDYNLGHFYYLQSFNFILDLFFRFSKLSINAFLIHLAISEYSATCSFWIYFNTSGFCILVL